MAAEAREITQNEIGAFLKTKQPTIYYNKINPKDSLREYYEDAVAGPFFVYLMILSIAGIATSFATLDEIGGYETMYEGTSREYETISDEGSLYLLALTIFAPFMLASSFAAIHYCLTKPDIILDEADRNSPDKETEAKENWAREQLEAARNKPRSFFSWGASRNGDVSTREPLLAPNTNSIN